MQWLRLYTEVLDDPKVQRLPDHLFKTWVNLLCLARKNEGRLPADIQDMAFALRLSADEMQQRFAALKEAGLFDGAEPHNWDGRQFKSDHDAAERMRRSREKRALRNSGVTRNNDVTPPEQSRADTEQTQRPARARAKPREGLKGNGFGGPEHSLPPDWQPTDADVDYARSKGHDPPSVARINRKVRELSNRGEKRRDWSETFRWFCDKEAERRPLKPIGQALR